VLQKNILLFQLNNSVLNKLYRYYNSRYNILDFISSAEFDLAVTESQSILNRETHTYETLSLHEIYAFTPIPESVELEKLNVLNNPDFKLCSIEAASKNSISIKQNDDKSQKLLKFEIIERGISLDRILLTTPSTKEISAVLTLILIPENILDEMTKLILKFLPWDKIALTQIAFLSLPAKHHTRYFSDKSVAIIQVPGYPAELVKILEASKLPLYIFYNQTMINRARIFIRIGEEKLLAAKLQTPVLPNPTYYLTGTAKPTLTINSKLFSNLLKLCTIKSPEIQQSKNAISKTFEISINMKSSSLSSKTNFSNHRFWSALRSQILNIYYSFNKYLMSQHLRFAAIKLQDIDDIVFVFEGIFFNQIEENPKLDIIKESFLWFNEAAESIYIPQIMYLSPMPDQSWFTENLMKGIGNKSSEFIQSNYFIFPPVDFLKAFVRSKSDDTRFLLPDRKISMQEIFLHPISADSWNDSSQLIYYLFPNLQRALSKEIDDKFFKIKDINNEKPEVS